jgi:flavodoxin
MIYQRQFDQNFLLINIVSEKTMKKAIVVYNSKNGTTKNYGEEISDFLKKKDFDSRAVSINECSSEEIANSDYVFLGCWTSGLFIFGQKPEQEWVDFVQKAPDLSDKKVGLFTTYKIATGSMFKRMKKYLRYNPENPFIELKSRDGHLPISSRLMINDFVKA